MRLLLIATVALLSLGKEANAQNTEYKNWYYDSREKLYQTIKGNSYDVIFFGNSITERGPWDELLGAKLKIGNRGIGGDNTYGMKARIADVVSQKPKKIFLMMGINDVGRGLPTESILNNYEEIIEIIREKSPRTKIYIQSVLPMNENKLGYDYLKGKEQQVRALGEGARLIAEKYKLTYVDVKSVLANDYVLKEEYTSDGIHLNTDAYIRWVQFLMDKRYL